MFVKLSSLSEMISLASRNLTSLVPIDVLMILAATDRRRGREGERGRGLKIHEREGGGAGETRVITGREISKG